MSDPSLTNINNLHYLFDKRKLLAQYGKGTFQNVDEALLAVKEKMKNVFKNNAKDIFLSNQTLFKQYDKIGGGKIEDWEDFVELLNHSSFSANHQMFNFIKVK
ncbi:hypothetical protein [Flavobacterium oreochromis]|uniref:hypothetical protein n=1 Tax=Flavobacterium oreochromis TaxID=2906078 RepID=UPI000F5094EF|nr:hypothetical protein [Flavobacterium oreochromis]